MSQEISIAFKQWAVVVEAILEGRHCLLLRKGDLREVHQEFRIRHPRFLCYPTYEDQRAEQLLPEWREKLRRMQALRPDGSHVLLKCYCEAEAVWEIRDLRRIQDLSPWTIWSPEQLQAEVSNGPAHCALLVRAHRLPQAREIAELGRYATSGSWVDLLDEISIEGARPVLTDEVFRRRAGDLQRLLG